MNILYLHGFGSSGQSNTVEYLKKALPDCQVTAPDIPVDPAEALPFLKKLCKEENFAIVIGTSMGAMYAQQLHPAHYRICVNPALHLSQLTDVLKVGTFPFFQPRKDGSTEFTITEEIVQHFREMEEHQFDEWKPDDSDNIHCFGLFGTNDTTVNCREEFSRYYSNVRTFEGGHRMNQKVLKNVVVPIIAAISLKNNPLSHLWTAEKSNRVALWRMWHDSPYYGEKTTEEEIQCTVPDVETAKAYFEARYIRECVCGGTPSLLPPHLNRHYTSEELDAYYKKERKLERMHLDMRDQIITGENGKKGLRDVCGNMLIGPQFDDIPELYSCFERCRLIPVILNNRYFLYDIKERKLLTRGYERIFRYFWAYMEYFVVVENGKKGILDGCDGTETTPIDLDEIYDMPDPDGDVPVVKNGKIGLLWGKTYTQPIFDDIILVSEEWTRVKLNGKWGWVDGDGKFTTKKSKAGFGSFYDFMK